MYKPLSLKTRPQISYSTSTMPRKGLNTADIAQLMNMDYCISLKNYLPKRYGIEKRRGLKKIWEVAGANPITLLEKFTSTIWIFGYSTTIAAYNTSTEAITTIKSNFSANDGFDGERYGEYFFVCNGVEKIWMIDNALAISEVAASPICGGLKVIGNRLHAFNLSTDSSADQYSDVDDGSNPPFDSWNVSTTATQGGRVNYRNAGTARAVCQNGPYTIVFCDDGFYSYYIDQLDSSGTLKKIEVIQNYTQDFGGARGAIETPHGIFYLNEAGLWQMVSVGQTDVPMSRQQILTSNLIKSDYFKNITQTSADLIYDTNQNIILVACAKDSASNNHVIGYDIDLKAFFEIENWNINRLAKSNQEIYGASSVSTKVYKLFDGTDDDGLDISTECVFEVPMKGLLNANSNNGIYSAGLLSPSTTIHIKTDIFDLNGDLTETKTDYTWGANSTGSAEDMVEWGGEFFGSFFGGAYEDAETDGLIESFGGGSVRINNFQRLRIKITNADKYRHIITWLSAKITTKSPIRRRNFTKIT